jgi:tRNA threonylcarbamoyladenosine biosynthesis protein TsaE
MLTTSSPDETRALGVRIGEAALAGDIVCLTGDLGAGKTTLTQGIGAGLGLGPDAGIVSPTFTILAEHTGGRLPLFHFDVYRLRGPSDLIDIGFDDYVDAGGVIVIEWPERIAGALPADRLDITLSFPDSESPPDPGGMPDRRDPRAEQAGGVGHVLSDRRRIALAATGPGARRLLEAITP